MEIKTEGYAFGGDRNVYLWIGTVDTRGARFTAKAQEIDGKTGETMNRQELESEMDGMRQLIKYKRTTQFSYVRFNITF